MGKRDLRKATGLFAALLAGALLADAAPARADAALDAFLARSDDPQPTLALERAVAAALARNDRGWFARAARREDRPLNRGLSAIETAKRAPADAVRVGPCNLAWLTLRSYIVRTARDMRAVPTTAPLSQAAPGDVANIFAEQMSRCEMIRRLPRARRLVGVDASGA